MTIGEKIYPIEIYTTNAGKEKRGVWMDSRAEASKYSARAFTTSANKGKWFVDEYWFPKDSSIKKVANAEGDGAVFSARDSAPEKEMTIGVFQTLVKAALRKIPNAPTIEVFATPAEAGLSAPSDVVVSGAVTADGRIYVFQSGVSSVIDVQRVIFHELFHKGLQNSMLGEAYESAMLEFAAGDGPGSMNGLEKSTTMLCHSYPRSTEMIHTGLNHYPPKTGTHTPPPPYLKSKPSTAG